MATTASSGTKTSGSLDTVYDLATTTTVGVFVCQWNLTNLVKSDISRCFVTTKVLTGDTEATIYEGVFANDLGANCIVHSPPIVSMFSLTMKYEQTDGTWRDVPWALIQIDA
jgi:hypothetical protein